MLWRRLLERWSKDYGFQSGNLVTRYLQPRGLQEAMTRLPEVDDSRYVVTGSFAAERWAPYAPARALMLYADDPTAVANRLGLRPVESGANVLIAAPATDVVFERMVVNDGIRLAAPSQIAVDLLTGPGRNPSEANALLDWMETNEPSWRS